MKKVVLLIFLINCISCADNDVIISHGGEELPFYRLEIEPSLSYDRSTLLIVRADTQLTQFNGIYSARVSNPIRNVELLGENFLSPTLAVESKRIAFLQNGALSLYDPITDSSTHPLQNNFQELLFMSDTVLILNADSTIYLYNLFTEEFSAIATGYYPTVYNADTLSYLKTIGADRYEINLLPIGQFANFALSALMPIDTFIVSNLQSFGIEPQLQRYCFAGQNGDKYDVYVGGVGIDTVWQVVESDYSDVVMLDMHTVLYTGIDGRLYRVNFEGTASFPFWAAVDPQDL